MKQKGNIVLIILIIAAAIGGIFYLYQLSNNRYKTTALPQPTTQPSPSSDETANWKIYTNEKIGVSFKYPPDWKVVMDEILEQLGIVKLTYMEDDKEYSFYVGAKGRGGSPADEITNESISFGDLIYSKRSWIKDGKVFFIVATPVNFSVGGGIEINLPPNNTENYIKIFELILSSFQPLKS